MQSRLLHHDGTRTFVLVFERGDEVIEGLLSFAREHELKTARFTGIGALSEVKLAFFDPETREYEDIPVGEQVEVLNLTGNVAQHEGAPKIHAHMVVGKRDGTALGGHLVEAHVDPTLEVTLVESPEYLEREIEEQSGLPLIKLRGNGE